MALSPASSHGGGSFNGGTITTPLVISGAVSAKLLDLLVAAAPDWEIQFEPADQGSGNVDAIGVLSAAGTGKARLSLSDDVTAGYVNFDSQGTCIVGPHGVTGVVFGVGADGLTNLFKVNSDGSYLSAPPVPATQAFVSGAAAQISTTRDVRTTTPFTGDATNNAATCKIEISKDNLTYYTLNTVSIAAALNLTGALAQDIDVYLPAAWYLKLTVVHGSLGATTYY